MTAAVSIDVAMAVPRLSIIDAMDDEAIFAPYFTGDSWNGWRTVLKAAKALPMTADETTFFRSIADRGPPLRPFKEAWFIVGRRGGKDAIASLLAAFAASTFDQQHRLRPGERAQVVCLACDRDQSKIVLSYPARLFSG